MSDVNGTPQTEKATKLRRKPKRESVLQHTFAAARHNTTSSSPWLESQQPGSGFLQRQCACGTHTIAGGECDSCRQKRESSSLQWTATKRVAYNTALSNPVEVQTYPEPGFAHDFSQVSIHGTGSTMAQDRLTISQEFDLQEIEPQTKAHPTSRLIRNLSLPSSRLEHSSQIQRNRLTSADLRRRRGTSATYDQFMRRVYDFQVQLWTTQGAHYVAGLPSTELVRLSSRDALPGRPIQLHRDIAPKVQALVADARRDLAAAKAAGEVNAQDVTDIRIRSGYRSAQSQFGIWEREYPNYYRDTRRHRRGLPGGEHGDEAARYLAQYINERVFSPGYSPHQQGHTIDLTYEENRAWARADSSPAGIRRWESSWLYGWLRTHAAQYGFVQNPNINEPWHWEYSQLIEIVISLFRSLKELLLPVLRPLIQLFGGEEAERMSEPEPSQQINEPSGR